MPYHGYSGPGMFGRGYGAFVPTPGLWARLQTSLLLTNGTGSPTYSRATIATVSDHESIIRSVISGEARFPGARRVHNLIATKSEDWTNAAWTKSASMTATATTLEAAAANQTVLQAYTGASKLYVLRVRMSRITGTGNINLTLDNGSTWTTVTLTGSDQVFSISQTIANPTVGIRIVTNGDKINADQIQLQDKSGAASAAPDDYISVGVLSTPWNGANVDGVKYFDTTNGNSVASNVVTEALASAISTSTLIGYFSEGARTNRCLQSEEFDEAVWVSGGGGIAVDDQTVAAPDGATAADTLLASGANGTLIQDLGVVASAAKAFSIWLKRKTGTGNIDLTMDGGATWTTKAITTSWVRYEVTQTLADEDVGIRIVTSGDAVYAWGAQVETAAFASSYIPTAAAAVVRNVDAGSQPTAGNQSDTHGTAYAEVTYSDWSQATGQAIGDGTEALLRPATNVSGVTAYDGVNTASGQAGVPTGTVKIAVVWRGSVMNVFANGVKGANATYDGAFTLSSLGFGNGGLFASMRNMKIWQVALTDAQVFSL